MTTYSAASDSIKPGNGSQLRRIACLLVSIAWSLSILPGRSAHAQEQTAAETAPPADSAAPSEPAPLPAAGQNPEAQSNTSSNAQSEIGVRQLLELLGLNEKFFSTFHDGQPLADEHREQLLQLLGGLGRIAPSILVEAAHSPLTLDRIYDDPAAARGEIFRLRFDVVRVTPEKLPPELAKRFGFSEYYRCQANMGVYPLELIARHVPSSWKRDRPIDEPCTALAMFLQKLPAASNSAPESETGQPPASDHPPLLFATDRIAWHPVTLLAYLGVDYGLLEGVKDRTPTLEREVFYQMLAASSRMSPEYLQYQIRRHLKSQLELQERLARNRDLPPQTRADAERALERLQTGVYDVVPLFNEPAKNRGRLVVLEGEALRAIEIQIDDVEIKRRFGLDHYFEVEIITADSDNNPIVCCLVELPPGMPLGESIHESVRVAGFFFKSWAFRSDAASGRSTEDGERKLQVAPLLVGKTLEIVAPLRFTPPTQSLQLLAGLAVVLAISGIALWRARQKDREARSRLLGNRADLPDTISLEASEAEPRAGGTTKS